jgi:teichuronic acid biosynthesis glycosyltransferase TuaC
MARELSHESSNRSNSLNVLVVSRQWPTPERPDVAPFLVTEVEALERAGVTVQRMVLRGGKDPRAYRRARAAVEAMQRNGGIDLVHAHFGQSALAVPRKVPLVVTLYDSDLEAMASRDRFSPSAIGMRVLSRRAARRADGVIVAADRLTRQLPSGVRSSAIPPGVDLAIFRPVPMEVSRKALDLPTSGKLVLLCGLGTAQRELLVGAFEGMRIVRRRMNADLIVLPGAPQQRVAQFVSACDVVLVMSRAVSDVLAAKHALACGRAIVAPNSDEYRELVPNEIRSTLFARADAASTARAIESVLSNGLVAPSPVVERFDADVTARRVVSVYASVVEDRRL